MPEELLPFDVEQYTKGRLSQTDPETVRALASAKVRARGYCGWHVSPVRQDTFVFDGEGCSRDLLLPTLKIVSVVSVSIDGTPLDPTVVKVSASVPGMLHRTDSNWPRGWSNISVTITHGYTMYQAPDFREAVLAMVDQAQALVGEGEGLGPLTKKRVDDVELGWSDNVQLVEMNRDALTSYKLYAL